MNPDNFKSRIQALIDKGLTSLENATFDAQTVKTLETLTKIVVMGENWKAGKDDLESKSIEDLAKELENME